MSIQNELLKRVNKITDLALSLRYHEMFIELRKFQLFIKESQIDPVDRLTGLPLREPANLAFSRLHHQAMREGNQILVVAVDVVGLKLLNDNQGYEVGDKIIRNVAEQLKHYVRKSDILARWGGDEFLIVFHNTATDSIMSRRQAMIALTRLRNHMKDCRVGYSWWPYDLPTETLDFEDVLGHLFAKAHDRAKSEEK